MSDNVMTSDFLRSHPLETGAHPIARHPPASNAESQG